MTITRNFLVAATILAFGTATAGASTLSTTGGATLTVDGGSTDNSNNCPAERPCLKLSAGNGSATNSAEFSLGGDPFTLTSFVYSFSDNSKVTATGPGVLTLNYAGLASPIALIGNKKGGPYTFSGSIENIVSFTLTNDGDGTIRLGAFDATATAAVPLPAAGLLLLAGIGAIGAVSGRRRKTVA